MRRRVALSRVRGALRAQQADATRRPGLRRSGRETPPRELTEAFYRLTTRDSRGHKLPCAGCGTTHGRIQAHHCIEKEALRREFPYGAVWVVCEPSEPSVVSPERRTLPLRAARRNEDCDLTREQIAWDPRNGMPLCRRCHDLHTTAARRIPRRRLPASAWEFAQELGERFVARLERTYPDD